MAEKKTNPEVKEELGPDGKPIATAQNVLPGETLVTIKLPLSKELQGDVFVRVNQRTWNIKRGEYVRVPECVVEVLNNSERATLEAIEYQRSVEKGAE